ncbi:O-antigen ligase family protein [Exilibacterium tricleocarpae]|nr:O-antigen ligase family protein [Exilibacterium tricleocarpae]
MLRQWNYIADYVFKRQLGLFAIIGGLMSTVHFSGVYYSHDTPKWFIFDCFTSLYIFLFFFKKQRALKLSPLSGLVFTLVVLSVASLWWAPHTVAGLEFILRLFNASLLAYCLINSFSGRSLANLFITTAFWSALVFCLVFFLERYALQRPYNVGTFSPIGFINNAGHVFNIWIPCLLIFAFQHRHQKALFWSAIITLLLIVSILMEAGTRGTIIGLTLGELIIFALIARKSVKRALIFLSVTTLMLLGIGIYQFVDTNQSGRLSGKIAVFKNSISAAAGQRIQLFENTASMSREEFFGVGANNFEYIHPKYALPGTSQASPFINERQILRTPHNIILKLYSELGLIGGSVFVAFLSYIFFSALANAVRGEYIDKWLFVAVFATLFHSLFSAVFLTPASLFFSTILFATVIRRSGFSGFIEIPVRKPFATAFLLIPLLSGLLLFSEYFAFQGRQYFDKDLLEKSLVLNPQNDRALYNLSQVELRRQRDLEASLEALNRFVELYPYHIAGLFSKAERHYQLGQLDRAQNTLDKVLNFYPSYQKARRLQHEIQKRKLLARRTRGY